MAEDNKDTGAAAGSEGAQRRASATGGAAGAAAAAGEPSSAAGESSEALGRRWMHENLAGGPLSRNTELWNAVHDAIPALAAMIDGRA